MREPSRIELVPDRQQRLECQGRWWEYGTTTWNSLEGLVAIGSGLPRTHWVLCRLASTHASRCSRRSSCRGILPVLTRQRTPPERGARCVSSEARSQHSATVR